MAGRHGRMGAVFVHRKVSYGYATFDVNQDNTLTYKFLLHPDELMDGDKVNFKTFPVRWQHALARRCSRASQRRYLSKPSRAVLFDAPLARAWNHVQRA